MTTTPPAVSAASSSSVPRSVSAVGSSSSANGAAGWKISSEGRPERARPIPIPYPIPLLRESGNRSRFGVPPGVAGNRCPPVIPKPIPALESVRARGRRRTRNRSRRRVLSDQSTEPLAARDRELDGLVDVDACRDELGGGGSRDVEELVDADRGALDEPFRSAGAPEGSEVGRGFQSPSTSRGVPGATPPGISEGEDGLERPGREVDELLAAHDDPSSAKETTADYTVVMFVFGIGLSSRTLSAGRASANASHWNAVVLERDECLEAGRAM